MAKTVSAVLFDPDGQPVAQLLFLVERFVENGEKPDIGVILFPRDHFFYRVDYVERERRQHLAFHQVKA